MKRCSMLLLIITISVMEGSFMFADNNKKTGENQIVLPSPDLKGTMTLEQALSKRRSERFFTDYELSIKEISQLLWSAYGVTGKGGRFGVSLKTAPSAGATYPMEIYLIKKDGFFHYVPESHSIEKVIDKDLRAELTSQAWVKTAPVSIVIAAVYGRTSKRYGDRAVQYVHFEAGHICQNVLLQATALGLGAVPIGAFDEKKVQEILSLNKEEIPLYIISAGRPKK